MHLLDHDKPPPHPFEHWLHTLDPDTASRDDVKPARSKVRCKSCLNYLTRNDLLTPIAGETQHFFTNPAGQGFDLQTYQQVEGVEVSGKPTDYFSWFEGFSWQYCYCRRCHQHLGWYFSCEGSSGESDAGFYALIIDRLLLD
ncbi:cereblon family protein [Ketobacter sp.]|uniref:cereblon family protein n=1 Tax=Ketobacter sp. TaxID=2083498 RepID=UPI000F229A38|nr:cereblon family protein [Ketobacter sp.]RLT98062.1 MAG: hypothetical protein D9N14_10555 [Ketobacter sp.]